MHVNDLHWLSEAKHAPSPHCDTRPQGEVSGLVLHSISLPPGEFGGAAITDLFLGRLDPEAHPYFKKIKGLRVSAHCLIRRDGQVIQYVGFDQRAWHAGKSRWQGRQRLNDFTIGVELEGDHRPFTRPQYARLVELTRALMGKYSALTPERITGHQHVAPLRKVDPGPSFDWQYYFQELRR